VPNGIGNDDFLVVLDLAKNSTNSIITSIRKDEEFFLKIGKGNDRWRNKTFPQSLEGFLLSVFDWGFEGFVLTNAPGISARGSRGFPAFNELLSIAYYYWFAKFTRLVLSFTILIILILLFLSQFN
jgi:hypothetical protein